MKRNEASMRLLPVVSTIVALLAPVANADSVNDAAGIYQEKCAPCHGADGNGQSPLGKAMKLRRLRSPDVRKQAAAGLKTTIIEGKGKMPAYGTKLSAVSISSLVAYIRNDFALPLSKPGLGSRPSVFAQMTQQQAFYYWVAVYGAPPDVVDRYAGVFDAQNYRRAMADEFERRRYREVIQSRISSGVSGLNFDEKYIYVSSLDSNNGAKFGEYSFDTQSFPIRQPNTGFSYFNYWVAGNGFEINPFDLGMALNVKDFRWMLPMPETAARALLQSHPNRQLTLRFIYSVTKAKRDVHSLRYYLTPFIHSIDVFADSAMTTRIGTLARDSSSPGTWRDSSTVVAGQKTIYYKGAYSAYWASNSRSISKFGELPSKVGAEYYRVIDHVGGKIKVKDYYITGELEMEGEYLPVCPDNKECPDGVFTWYYKNGYKRQQQRFVNGAEVRECGRLALIWEEDGKCKWEMRSECPCVDQESSSRETGTPGGSR